jgi:hypothetical protein
MNTTKTIALMLAGIMEMVVMLSVIRLLLRKVKRHAETDFKIKQAYGIWFTGLFLAACMISARTVAYLVEAIDNIQKIGSAGLVTEIIKVSALYIGLGAVWFLLWYFITRVFSAVIFGIRKEEEEMALDNLYYFLLRAALVIGFVFSLSPALDMVFRWFMPNVPVSFIH